MTESPMSSLALLVAEHSPAGAMPAISEALCRAGNPQVLAAVAVRPDTPTAVAADAIRRLWKSDGTSGFEPSTYRYRVSACPTLPAPLQLLIVGFLDTHCTKLSGHATDPDVLRVMLAASAPVKSAWKRLGGQPQPAARSGALHALPELAMRGRDDETFADLLKTVGFTATLESLLCGAAPADADDLLFDMTMRWGPRDPQAVSDAVLRSGRHELICQVASCGWASATLRDTVLGWIRTELRTGPTPSEEAVFNALYQLWNRLEGPQRDQMREEIRSANYWQKTRTEWLRNASVSDAERDAAADDERWRTLPVDQAATALEVLGHKLPFGAAELFVSRPDVPTDLAYTVSVKSAHLRKEWLTARPFDPEFAIWHLARTPGWIDADDLDVETAIAVLIRCAHNSSPHALESAVQACAPLFDAGDYLRLPWDVLIRIRNYEDAAAAALAARLAPVFESDPNVKALEQVLGNDWAHQLPAGEVLDAVAAAGR